MPSDLPETYILWLDFAKLAFCSTLIAQTKEVGIAMNSKQDNDFVEFWYRQYSTYLFRYACLFVDSHTAEEVVQETFRIVCEKGPLDQIEHPKTWLRKITEYVIKNRSREREKWMTMLVDAEKLPDDFWGRHEDETNIELERRWHDTIINTESSNCFCSCNVHIFNYECFSSPKNSQTR